MGNIDMEKITEAMVIEDQPQASGEVSEQELLGNLTEEPTTEAPAAQDSPAAAPAQNPEEARKAEISAGLDALTEEGVTNEELLAFSQDETARKDVQAGKDVVRAFMAYTRRQASAVKPESQGVGKKGVPTFTAPATSGAKDRSRIEDMTDAEFAEFSKRATQAAMSGKKVRIR